MLSARRKLCSHVYTSPR